MKQEKGAMAIEAALCIPILAVLIVAIAQFGIIINGALVLSEAARESARHYSVNINNEVPDPYDYGGNVVRERHSGDVAIEIYGGGGTFQAIEEDGYVTTIVRNRYPVIIPGFMMPQIGGGDSIIGPYDGENHSIWIRGTATFRLEELDEDE